MDANMETKEDVVVLSLNMVVAQIDGMTRRSSHAQLILKSDNAIYLMDDEKEIDLLGYGKQSDKMYDFLRGPFTDAFRVEKLILKLEQIQNGYIYEDKQARTWIFFMYGNIGK